MPKYDAERLRSNYQQIDTLNSEFLVDLARLKGSANAGRTELCEELLEKYGDDLKAQVYGLLAGPKDLSEGAVFEWTKKNFIAIKLLSSPDFNMAMLGRDVQFVEACCRDAVNFANKFMNRFTQPPAPDAVSDEEFEAELEKDKKEHVDRSYYEVYFNNPTLNGFTAPPDEVEEDEVDEITDELPTPALSREELNHAFYELHTENEELYNSLKYLLENNAEKKLQYNRELNLLNDPNQNAKKFDQVERNRYDAKKEEIITEAQDAAERKYRAQHDGEHISGEDIEKVRGDEKTRLEREAEGIEKTLTDASRVPLLHERVAIFGMKSFNERWNTILNEHRGDLQHQIYDVLKGPKSLNGVDMAQWYIKNHQTLLICSTAFANNVTLIDKDTDKALKDSVELAEKFQSLCDTTKFGYTHEAAENIGARFFVSGELNGDMGVESINREAFAEDGTLLWDSAENAEFKKADAEALFDKVKKNFNAYRGINGMRQYESVAKEEISVDNVLEGLKDFRRELKATDPFWVINSAKFDTLKDKLSETIDAIKEFRKHPVNSRMAGVKDALGKLQTAVSEYSTEKSGKAHTDRGDKRLDITKRLSVFNDKTLYHDLSKEWGVVSKKSLQNKIELASRSAGAIGYRIRDSRNADITKAFIDAVTTLNKFPKNEVKAEREKLALAVAGAARFTKANERRDFLNNADFGGVQDEMRSLSASGEKQIRANMSPEEKAAEKQAAAAEKAAKKNAKPLEAPGNNGIEDDDGIENDFDKFFTQRM